MAEQPDFTDYNPIPYLPRPLIAWEYLRRHPDYRRAWAKADRDRPRRTEIGTVLVKASRTTPAAESWGLRVFSDPREGATTAPVFWHADAFGRVLSARVREAADAGLENVVRIDAVRCRKAVLRIGERGQYLMLADPWRVAQLDCAGQDIGAEPFTLEIVLHRFPDIEGSLRLCQDLRLSLPQPAAAPAFAGRLAPGGNMAILTEGHPMAPSTLTHHLTARSPTGS